MSTNGFISFIADKDAKNSYSHWDSGPYDLGIKVLQWLRAESTKPDQLYALITSLKIVSDDDGPPPTPEDVTRFQRYVDYSVGDPAEEWYALLRGTQGDPTAILASGYVVYEGEPYGWIYEINADEQSFSVYRDDGGNRMTWPWSALPTDQRFLREAGRLGPNNE